MVPHQQLSVADWREVGFPLGIGIGITLARFLATGTGMGPGDRRTSRYELDGPKATTLAEPKWRTFEGFPGAGVLRRSQIRKPIAAKKRMRMTINVFNAFGSSLPRRD
jgi:hypothetical protein